jgi:hypothetical protein
MPMPAGAVEVGDNYRIDMADFAAKLDDDIAAVIISHMRGHTSDMDAIMALCDARGIPVIEDAAHSLGTTWHGRKIGTIGAVGCFSFQSYKLVNAGEGGILITDDADLVARAVIMSGAYEHNWKKHKGPEARTTPNWQRPLRAGRTAAALQHAAAEPLGRGDPPAAAEVARRVRDGRRNHDYVADRLNTSPWLDVPDRWPRRPRAGFDPVQPVGMDERRTRPAPLPRPPKARGVKVQVFGLSTDNARAFWNWQFIPGDVPDLPQTRAMLMRACDVRLPARLTEAELDFHRRGADRRGEDVMGERPAPTAPEAARRPAAPTGLTSC